MMDPSKSFDRQRADHNRDPHTTGDTAPGGVPCGAVQPVIPAGFRLICKCILFAPFQSKNPHPGSAVIDLPLILGTVRLPGRLIFRTDKIITVLQNPDLAGGQRRLPILQHMPDFICSFFVYMEIVPAAHILTIIQLRHPQIHTAHPVKIADLYNTIRITVHVFICAASPKTDITVIRGHADDLRFRIVFFQPDQRRLISRTKIRYLSYIFPRKKFS